jgi:hypothetical protein
MRALAGLSEQVYDITRDVVKTKREQEAVAEGTQAGLESAKTGQPVELKRATKFGGQVYNQYFTRSYNASVLSDVKFNVAKIQTENFDNVADFDSKVQGYLEGVLQGVDPQLAPEIQLQANDLIGKTRVNVLGKQQEKNLKEADEINATVATNFIDMSLKHLKDGDELQATETFNSYLSHMDDQRERLGDNIVDTAIRSATVNYQSQQARSGIQTLIESNKYVEALDVVEQVRLGNYAGSQTFTVAEQDALATTLTKDISNFMSIQDSQYDMQKKGQAVRHDTNFGMALTGLMSGEYDAGSLQVLFESNGISGSQYATLLNTYNTRGQGVDNFSVIANVQSLINSDPQQAMALIASNAGTNLTTDTAISLNRAAMDAKTAGGILTNERTKRYQDLVFATYTVTGPMGSIDQDKSERRATAKLVYQQRVLDGEDPATVAQDLVSFAEISMNEKTYNEQVDKLNEKAKLSEDNPSYISEQEYITEMTKLRNDKQAYDAYENYKNYVKQDLFKPKGAE